MIFSIEKSYNAFLEYPFRKKQLYYELCRENFGVYRTDNKEGKKMRKLHGNESFIRLHGVDKTILQEKFIKTLPISERREWSDFLKGKSGQECLNDFHRLTEDYDRVEDWYVFEKKELSKIAIAWCIENNIPYTLDPVPPLSDEERKELWEYFGITEDNIVPVED